MRWGGKRLFDILLAAAGCLSFLVPAVVISACIWIQSGRPVLFRQARVGRDGKHFVIWKFRTMSADGTVSGFGKLLRATAMDELPQLLNILNGEMSFVGPRPLVPEDLSALDQIPDGRRRLSIRPGLTGMAQLKAAKVPELSERVRWDLYYVDHASLLLDLQILLRSMRITLMGKWEKPRS